MLAVRHTPAFRKEQILTAATFLFEAQGYKATTMTQIAQKAQMATGLLYRYYKNKQHIYAACTQQLAIRQAQALPSSRIQQPAQQRYQNLVKRMTAFAISQNRSEAQQKERLLPALQRDELAEQMIPPMTEIIEAGIREGVFACQYPVITARLLSYMIVHSLPAGIDPQAEELALYLEAIYTISDHSLQIKKKPSS